ncbi:MAG: alpha/beta hydrolase [Opitutaceae bacterium]
MSKNKWFLLRGVVLAFFGASLVVAQPPHGLKNAGHGVQYVSAGTLTVEQMRGVLTLGVTGFLTAGFSPSPYSPAELINQFPNPRYPVRLYKVYYNSVIPELGNQRIRATGLVAIPDLKESRLPMISYQHGTVFERTSVPSNLPESYETQFIVAALASQGYAVIAADYFGLGETSVPNTYVVTGATEQACIDMLFASRAVLKAEDKQASHLFLHGWSMGGYNTFRFLKRLEMMGEAVTAASTAAAPTDIRVWISRLMLNPQPVDALWLVSAASNMVLAADAYELPGLAREAIRPRYLEAARRFYNFEISFETFFATTPSSFKEFFTPAFFASAHFGNTAFWNLMEKRENYRWKITTPLRNFYGEVDEVVPPDVATLPARIAPLFGSTTTTIPAGPKADHRATYLYSLTQLPAWHRQFLR